MSTAKALLKMIFIDVPFPKVGYVSFLEVMYIYIYTIYIFIFFYASISFWKVSHNNKKLDCVRLFQLTRQKRCG